MKKIIIILLFLLMAAPKTFAQSDNIALLTKKGFFDKKESGISNPVEDIKKALYLHLKYSNLYDIEGLKELYSENYINADGFDKKVYFELIKKTWESYPDIKYCMEITDIEINGTTAIAQVEEYATATTESKSGSVAGRGFLQSDSGSIYYLENINGVWKIVSDYVVFENTYLRYGAAKNTQISLIAPNQVSAGKEYTAALNISAPKDTLIIASIASEKITHPQTVAEEVFRKMPPIGPLERIFIANSNNINEYAVASFGMTKAEIKNGSEIKIYITGLGFAMSRVNVIPVNRFIIKDESKASDSKTAGAKVESDAKSD